MTHQLLLVDDNTEFRRSIEGYVGVLEWRYLESAGVEVPLLDTSLTTLVLLDFQLGRDGQAGDWLLNFRTQYPNLDMRIFLLTGNEGLDARLFFENNGLDGMLTKPFNLERLSELLPTGDASKSRESVEIAALLAETPSPEQWLTRAAQTLSPAIRLLQPPSLDVKYQNDAAKKFPLTVERRRGIEIMAGFLAKHPDQTRVVRMEWDSGTSGFLRRRMYRAEDVYWLAEDWLKAEDSDPGLIQLLSAKDWCETLDKLAGIMATQWGFTRVRYYRAIPLYKSDDVKLQPLWHHGGGFKNGDELAWYADFFRIQENDSSEAAFKDKAPWRIGEVGDDKEESSKGCKTIEWGNATRRAVVPIWKEDKPVALLSFDRRTDHLAPEEHPLAEENPWGTGISVSDMESMRGFLDTVKPLLIKISHDKQEQRMKEWHERLGMGLQATAIPDAKEAVMQVFDDFLKMENQRQGGMKLHSTMLLRCHDDGLLEIWAVAEIDGQNIPRNRLFETESLFGLAMKGVVVIHDMAAWWQENAYLLDECLPLLGATKECPPGYGSWLGLPLRQGNLVFGLLTAMTEERYEFTEPRVLALQESAERLQFMLLWGNAQAQRDWVARALAHEYREPINTLERLLDELPQQEQRDKAHALIRYLNASVENLRLLTETLDRLGGGAEQANVHETVTKVTVILSALYPSHISQPEISIPQNMTFAVPHEALFRILFNLMENACKYSPDGHPVRMVVQVVDGRGNIEVRNAAYRKIQLYDRKRIFLPYQRASDASSGKGAGIGLAVVRRLCLATGMECTLTDPGEGHSPSIAFTLSAPLVAQFQGVMP